MSLEIGLDAIGERIGALRGKISQQDFAEKLGIDRKTVGTWERGERLPDTRALLALWREFGADPAWVLTGAGFAPQTTEDERELLALFRSAPLAGKMAAVGALQGALGAGAKQSYMGDGGVMIGTVSGEASIRTGKKKG